jgi:UDP-GlcNAc:undecaprenyl-phosphate GlcNAc-1-phosphate transferase
MNYLLLSSIFIISLVTTSLLIRYAKSIGLLDIPNGRSTHTKATPKGAGIVFLFSVLLTLFLFDFEYLKTYYFILSSIAIVLIAGVWDDVSNIRPRTKLIFMFVSALVLYLNDFALFSLGTYFGYEIVLPTWFVFPFTFFAIAGFTNALNLMDGLDGLASVISIVMLMTFLAVGFKYNDELIISLSSFFIVTVFAFLLFNWHPAKIFMGDSGSLTLGMVISILAIRSAEYVAPISILFIIALPLMDTLIVIIRRFQRHKSLFEADKNHLHHFLNSISAYLTNVLKDVQIMIIILNTLKKKNKFILPIIIK